MVGDSGIRGQHKSLGHLVGQPGDCISGFGAAFFCFAEPQNEGAPYDLFDVTYGGGQFVAVGNLGIILRSTDGQTWVTNLIDPNITFNAVTFGGGMFAAVGDQHDPILFGLIKPAILTSRDGVLWSKDEPGVFRRRKRRLCGTLMGSTGYLNQELFSFIALRLWAVCFSVSAVRRLRSPLMDYFGPTAPILLSTIFTASPQGKYVCRRGRHRQYCPVRSGH